VTLVFAVFFFAGGGATYCTRYFEIVLVEGIPDDLNCELLTTVLPSCGEIPDMDLFVNVDCSGNETVSARGELYYVDEVKPGVTSVDLQEISQCERFYVSSVFLCSLLDT